MSGFQNYDQFDFSNVPGRGEMNVADIVESLKAKLKLANYYLTVDRRVEFLKTIQCQHDELEANFFEERATLEAKYEKLFDPLYTKRFEIISGAVEVEGIDESITEDKRKKEKGVPEFWLTAMKNNEVLANKIQERDEDALKYLKDIKWCKIDNPRGFKLEFFFGPNPYFRNSVLTKTYYVMDDHDPVLEEAIGTGIEWYPGENLTRKQRKKKPKKGSKNAKRATKSGKCESFFNFFSPPRIPRESEYIRDNDAKNLQKRLEQDYDIGSTIRDKIIPCAVSWFIGESLSYRFLGHEDDDGDEEEYGDGDNE